MNWKASLGLFLAGAIGGGFGAIKLFPPKPSPPEIKTEIKTRTIRTTLPGGKVVEETFSESKSDQRNFKSRYGVSLYHDKSLSADARLGDLPLFLIISSDLKSDHRIGLRLEF